MKIQWDKIYHFVVGSYIFLVAFVLIHFKFEKSIELANSTGLLLSILFGYGKEKYDEWDYGRFDKMDWLATTLGGVTAYIILNIIF